MCDPMTLAATSLASTVLGGVNSSAASYTASAGTKASYELQAAVDRNNAILADYQASDAIERGKLTADKYRRGMAQVKGSAIADRAASGTEVNSGSALDIYAGIDAIAAVDESTIRQNAVREAMGYKIDAMNGHNNAGLYSFRASQENPSQAAFGTFLGTAGQVAGRWYNYRHEWNNTRG